MVTLLLLPATCSLARPTQCSAPVYSTRLATKPLRLLIRPPVRPLQRRSFTTSPRLRAEKSHYEVLGIPVDCSKADLKKRFYVLSKETHPDVSKTHNASDRFAEVSEAYSVLGNDEKRRRYDRDVMPRFHPAPSRSGARGRSGTYAGSRPATGLSKRRATFRGPPPSYYQSAARNKEEHARREQESYNAGAQAGQFDPSQYAAHGMWDPTFNPTPVYKTQTAEDVRRHARRQAEMAAAQQYAEEESNFWARFVMVSGVVAFGVGMGTIISRMSNAPRGGLLKGDGSKRNTGGKELAAAK